MEGCHAGQDQRSEVLYWEVWWMHSNTLESSPVSIRLAIQPPTTAYHLLWKPGRPTPQRGQAGMKRNRRASDARREQFQPSAQAGFLTLREGSASEGLGACLNSRNWDHTLMCAFERQRQPKAGESG